MNHESTTNSELAQSLPSLELANRAIAHAKAVIDPAQPDITTMPKDMDLSPRVIGAEAAVLVGQMLRSGRLIDFAL